MTKAQSTVEYAILIAIVVGAIVAMQGYIQRGMQGKIRDMAEQISPDQYEAGGTVSEYTINQSGTLTRNYIGKKEDAQRLGVSQGTTNTWQNETTTRSGYETTRPTID